MEVACSSQSQPVSRQRKEVVERRWPLGIGSGAPPHRAEQQVHSYGVGMDRDRKRGITEEGQGEKNEVEGEIESEESDLAMGLEVEGTEAYA